MGTVRCVDGPVAQDEQLSSLAILFVAVKYLNALWIDCVKGSTKITVERGHEPELFGSIGIYIDFFSPSAFNGFLRLVCSFSPIGRILLFNPTIDLSL